MSLFGLCNICGGDDLQGGEDGYFYCSACGSQSQQYQEQVLDYEALAGYTRRTQRNVAAAVEAAGDIRAAADDPVPPLPSSQAPLFSHFGFTDSSKPWEIPLASRVHAHTSADYLCQPLDPMDTMYVDAASIRTLYIEGFQHLIQLQCEAVVQDFHASPLICGIIGSIWLRFLTFTRVLEKDWAKEVIQVEEAREEQRKRKLNKRKNERELDEDQEGLEDKTVQMRMALHLVWLGALKERIPLSASLALIYLACHMASESILPTDIVQWACKGRLPYLAAFCEIEKKRYGLAWPIKADLMFKPVDVLGAKKLEFMAATIAKRIGLQLPPVNFKAISHRFLKELNLPVEKLSIYTNRFYDWYTPPGLWLSDEAQALPSRVYVMAMVMIILKVLYKIDGRLYAGTHAVGCGKGVGSPSGRKTLDDQACFAPASKRKHATQKAASQECGLQDTSMADDPYGNIQVPGRKSTQNFCHNIAETSGEPDDEWSAKYLLEKLEKSWKDHKIQPFDYEKDLTPYLKYCQDVIFSGLKLEGEEESVCERLWRLYEQPHKKESAVSLKEPSLPNTPDVQSLSGDSNSSFASFNGPKEGNRTVSETCDSEAEKVSQATFENLVEHEEDSKDRRGFRSLEELLEDMESLGFSCLPPRKQPLIPGKYLRYVRKKAKDGNALKVLHADYFMVLCVCAKVIRVQPIALYWCIQRVENALRNIEEKAKDFTESGPQIAVV